MRKRSFAFRRLTVMGAFLAVCLAGAAEYSGLGSFCSMGAAAIAMVCPLGAIEAMLAAREVFPWLAAGLILMAVPVVLFGRFFCGWLCPVPLFRKIVWNRLDEEKREVSAADESLTQKKTGMLVLGITLGSAAACGFPVFCLVCPIGIAFALGLAVLRLFGMSEPSWDLLFFPLVLFLELTVFRHWCSRFCPVGALLSLLSRTRSWLRPYVDGGRCLGQHGKSCGQCRRVCSFGVDLQQEKTMPACTKCGICAEKCPAGAIHFQWKKE